jgi:hypothetical protein
MLGTGLPHQEMQEVKTQVIELRRRSPAIALLALLVLQTALTAAPARSSSASLSMSVIGMFPRLVGEFAYADLKSARQCPWFSQFREQLLPPRFRQFEQVLSSAGIDANVQVEELAWGELPLSKNGEQGIGVALGSFDPSSIEDRFKQQKLPMVEYRSYHLYRSGDVLLTFLDSSTAAFGPRLALEKLVDVRMGTGESLLTNDSLFPLISEANGSGVFWVALDKSNAHFAMQQLVPQASQFRQAGAVINRVHAIMIEVDAGHGMDARFQVVCDSVNDANLLGVALQAGIMYRSYQDAQSQPDLAKVLANIRVTPSGDRLVIEAPVSDDQLGALCKTMTVAVPM